MPDSPLLTTPSRTRAFRADDPFQMLIRQLLHEMRIDLPPEKRNDVYSLKFDGELDVHLLSPRAGRMDIVAEVGTLDNLEACDTLLHLLDLNRFDTGRSPPCLSLDRENGLILMWMQLLLAALDLPMLMTTLQHMLDGVNAARHGLRASPPSRAATTTLLKTRASVLAILKKTTR